MHNNKICMENQKNIFIQYKKYHLSIFCVKKSNRTIQKIKRSHFNTL